MKTSLKCFCFCTQEYKNVFQVSTSLRTCIRQRVETIARSANSYCSHIGRSCSFTLNDWQSSRLVKRINHATYQTDISLIPYCMSYRCPWCMIYVISMRFSQQFSVAWFSVACFGVRVSLMFHLMFVHYTFCSVLVAEWPPFGK